MRFAELPPEHQAWLIRKREKDAETWGFTRGPKSLRSAPTLGELCFLQRKDAGLTIKQLGENAGLSHVSVIKRERNMGDVKALADYWGLV